MVLGMYIYIYTMFGTKCWPNSLVFGRQRSNTAPSSAASWVELQRLMMMRAQASRDEKAVSFIHDSYGKIVVPFLEDHPI